MDELVAEFLTETNESLDELDLDLVNLEQNPNDADLLGKIFRLVHTIKGTCGFLALPRLEKVAHHAENVLGRFRDGDLEVTPDYVTLIFESIDRVKFIVGELENTGSEPDGDDSELIEKLDAVYEGREADLAPAEKPPVEAEDAEKVEESSDSQEQMGVISQEELDALEAAFQAAPGPEDMAAEEASESPEGAVDKPVSAQTLRVNVDVLENLMTMVSELVLTRNQLLQILRHQDESEFTTPLQRLNHVVSDLQDGVMKTRMQPVGNAWTKLPRIVRDLCIELDKKVDLEMQGQETELDRQVLELIKDPLTHMVRNSIDHGIEDAKTRQEAGKPETGKVILNAYHEGGHIIIEIQDDGKGFSSKKIAEKAMKNGLVTPQELAEMSENQIQKFIFHAGLSTAEKITSVSGRGVGMDVVRTNIEKIGGSIDLKSVEGRGSTFTIKIPLTLAIVSALIVEAQDERFAIPQLSVRELVMTSKDNQIEMIKGSPVFRLRDRLLPLVSLDELLRLRGFGGSAPQTVQHADDDVENNSTDLGSNQYIVVTQVGATDFGIIVDRIFDTEEIVVKPVAKILKDIEIFSGNTILGDGSVIMILDPNGIANSIGQIEAAAADVSKNAQDVAHAHAKQKTALLLFMAGDDTPKTVPLSLVARLEKVDPAAIESSSGMMMVQYRDQLMPLVKFNESIQLEPGQQKPVLVFVDKQQSMGLIVDEIIDITEEHINVQLEGSKSGLMGSAIINDKATDVIDVFHYLTKAHPQWFQDPGSDVPFESEADGSAASPAQSSANGKANGSGDNMNSRSRRRAKKRILLVDDSPFFRNMLEPFLNVSGYEVTSLDSAYEALKLCEDGEVFDLIVSDIEMPEMDGFEFAQKVRADSKWQSVPMVALTSHATDADVARGMEVGFSKYVAKFDKDTLLNTLTKTLAEAPTEH